MLVRLLNDQINPYWPQIRKVIEDGARSGEPASEEDIKNILASIYDGTLTCWISGNQSGINGVVLTSILDDTAAKKKSLVIYFAYRFGDAIREDWFDAVNTLKRYAKSIGCYRVVAHPYSLEVVSLCEKLGGKLVNYVIEFDLEVKDGS